MVTTEMQVAADRPSAEAADRLRTSPAVLFAMRYTNDIGFVWDSLSRTYDAVAELLAPRVRALIAYPELRPNPSFKPRFLQPVAGDFYVITAANRGQLTALIREQHVRLIFYMGCAPREVDLAFLHSLGVRTINYEQDSYVENSHQSGLRRALKRLVRSRLQWNIHDLYLANAEHQRRFLLSFAGLPPERVRTVVNGVNTQMFCPGPAPDAAALGLPRTRFYAVAVCQARPEKRVDFLIQAAAELFRRRPELSLTFVYVGDGQCLAAWQDLAASLGLAGRFCFVGYCKDPAPFCRLATMLVHAADRESFGLVLAEAMAVGKPVVATESAGPREIIACGETGFLVARDDRDGFVEALLRLLDHDDLRERFSQAALERARECFSDARQARELRHAIVEQLVVSGRLKGGAMVSATSPGPHTPAPPPRRIPDRRPGVVFAMRYRDDIGYVWTTKARTYDAVADSLAGEAHCLLAYPERSDHPAYQPHRAVPVAADFYSTDPANRPHLAELLEKERVRVVVYMGCQPSTIDLRFLRRHGVRTVNYEVDSYPHDRQQSYLRWALKRLVRGRLHWNLHDIYVANAHNQRRFLLSYACLPPERVQTVVNGIDTHLFSPGPASDPTAFGLPRTDYYAVSISQARPEKRVDFLLDVAERLFRQRPNLSLTFVHVGGGECLSTWRAKANALKLEKHFFFLGYQPDPLPLLRLATVLVHAAEYESFGNVLAEAMAVGKPVIATEAAGPRELILPDTTGCLVGKDDRDGFVAALLKLLDDPELRRRQGEAALVRARRSFSLEGQTQALGQVIRDQLALTRSPVTQVRP